MAKILKVTFFVLFVLVMSVNFQGRAHAKGKKSRPFDFAKMAGMFQCSEGGTLVIASDFSYEDAAKGSLVHHAYFDDSSGRRIGAFRIVFPAYSLPEMVKNLDYDHRDALRALSRLLGFSYNENSFTVSQSILDYLNADAGRLAVGLWFSYEYRQHLASAQMLISAVSVDDLRFSYLDDQRGGVGPYASQLPAYATCTRK